MSHVPVSLRARAAWDPLLAELLRNRWPLTKAAYLRLMLHGNHVDFPLDPEIVERVPDDLPGELPTDRTDLEAAIPATPA